MEKHSKIWIKILIIIGSVCLIAAAILFIRQFLQSSRAEAQLDAIRESAEALQESVEDIPEVTEPSQETGDIIPEETGEASEPDSVQGTENSPEEPEESAAVPNPYADVFASYNDVAGWLTVPDTNIDYPVVWTPEDENYYLYRDIDGNKDNNGSLILDTDSFVDPISTNLIIHGHNMRSGAMFGNLTDYESEDFYRDHKQITLYTEECRRDYEVIAVFRSQVYKKSDTVFKYYKFFQADTEEEFEDFYQNIKNLSLYDTGVTAEFGDRFITLSTCVYHVEQGRFVVVAKEVECSDSYLPVEE